MSINKIIFNHTAGSKINQKETLSFDSWDEIIVGRSEESQINFHNEVGVSRKHARIYKGDTLGQFFIEDMDSLNGVLVNGVKITETTELFAGDKIQLGFKGPEFMFDLSPKPMMQKPTEIMKVPDETEAYVIEKSNEKERTNGVSKHTFERIITQERNQNKKRLVNTAVVLVCLAAILGFTFKDNLFKSERIVENRIIERDQWRPDIIAEENMDKVVFIEVGYKLIYTGTSDVVYHQYMQHNKQLVPVFILNNEGQLEPLLGLKKNTSEGAPIAKNGITGSGFVVDENGFLMTNKHVAAPWTAPYQFPPEAQNGMLIENINGKWKLTQEVSAPTNWIPARTKFFGQQPISGKLLTGEHSYLDVTFAKSDQRTPAKVSRLSEVHDVALLKIDMIGEIQKVALPQYNDEMRQGERIAVLGYPGISPNGISIAQSDNPMYENRQSMVPDPTLTDGLISKIIRNAENATLSKNQYYSFYGEHYQLNISETGAGNSGGPVFNKHNEVIGIFSSMMMDAQGTKITFAIPIKYGLDLMSNKTVIR